MSTILRKAYATIAANVAETLREERLDYDRFLPALHQQVISMVEEMDKDAAFWDLDDLNWAANQEREAKLFLEGLGDALSDLQSAITQSLPSDDQIILHRIKSAAATLQNLKRRMEA
jgi:hypothetical protein